MTILLPALVIFTLALLIFRKVQAQKKLLEEARIFEDMLKQARIIRWNYQRSLQTSREIIKKSEQESNQLAILKLELNDLRSGLREKLIDLKMELETSENTDFDKRVIEQMKTEINQKWGFINQRKIAFRSLEDNCNATHSSMEEAVEQESALSRRWTEEKETVMNLWRKISPKIRVTNPHTFLN